MKCRTTDHRAIPFDDRIVLQITLKALLVALDQDPGLLQRNDQT